MKINIQKIFDFLANLDEKTRYGILIGVLLSVFLLDYLILMKPQIDALSKISPEINILATDLKSVKEDIKKIESYKKEVVNMKVKVEEVNLRLRAKEEVSLILENISLLANKNGIKIDQIMPYPQDQSVLLKDKIRKYYALPILLDARGSFHDVGRLLYQIEGENDFLKVDTFTVSSGSFEQEHRFKLTLTAVVYEEIESQE